VLQHIISIAVLAIFIGLLMIDDAGAYFPFCVFLAVLLRLLVLSLLQNMERIVPFQMVWTVV